MRVQIANNETDKFEIRHLEGVSSMCLDDVGFWFVCFTSDWFFQKAIKAGYLEEYTARIKHGRLKKSWASRVYIDA